MPTLDPVTGMPIPSVDDVQELTDEAESTPTVGRIESAPMPSLPEITQDTAMQEPTLSPEQRIDEIINNMSDDEIAYALEHGVFDPRVGIDIPEEEATSQELTDAYTAEVQSMEPAQGTATSSILDLIGSKEAPKGYNQINGKNQFAPLDEMTINEVYQLQNSMVNSSNHESSAVGRYQIINSTLKDLVKTMGLTGNEKFTPELQDQMAVTLLKRRGLDLYLNGEMSTEQFGNNIAKEWASFPVLTGNKMGQSYYAGVGSNRALVSPEEVLASLNLLNENGGIDYTPMRRGPEVLIPFLYQGQEQYTKEGRKYYQNQYGEQVTERSITEQFPNGNWYNIPTVYDGKFVEPNEAVDRILSTEDSGMFYDPETHRMLTPYKTMDEAVLAAESRSPSLEFKPDVVPGVGSIEAVEPTIRSKVGEVVRTALGEMGFTTVRSTSQKIENLIDFVPGVGDAIGIQEGSRAFKEGAKEGDALKMTLGAAETAGGVIGIVPGVGDSIGLAILVGAKRLRRGSKAAQRLDMALKLDAQNVDARKIWEVTGANKSPLDGEWRVEIDDSPVRMKVKEERAATRKARIESIPDRFPELKKDSKEWRVDDFFDHPELFDTYPELKNLKLYSLPQGSARGEFQPGRFAVGIDFKMNREDVLDTLVHELQHAVQSVENLPPGSSPTDFGFDKWTRLQSQANDGALKSGYAILDTIAPKSNRGNFYIRADIADILNGLTGDASSRNYDEILQMVQDPDLFSANFFLIQGFSDAYDKLDSAGQQLVEDAIFDLMDKVDTMAEAQLQRMSAFQKYLDTLGEIEARVVSDRRKLTFGERLKRHFDEDFFRESEQDAADYFDR